MQEKPHKFQFVPNEKQVSYDNHLLYIVALINNLWYDRISEHSMFLQVKAANKIIKTSAQNGKCKRVDGVPVFSAQNLDIAIASPDGVKWCVLFHFILSQ